jgi:hypothetical protein
VKPRLASTSDQSDIVLGVPETTGTVAVGVLPTEVVAVVPGVELAVAVGFTAAPSSRKSMDGFPHQCSCAIANADGVGVAVGSGLPPNELVHEARNTFDRNRIIASNNQINLFSECFKLDVIRDTIIKSPVFQTLSLEGCEYFDQIETP